MKNLINLFAHLFTLLSLSVIGTIICFTAYAGAGAGVAAVAESKQQLSSQLNNRGTKLLLALKLGNLAAVMKLFSEEKTLINPNVKGGILGQTALHLAAEKGILGIIISLIENYNAKLNLKDNKGKTALLIAIESGHADVALLLITKGADLKSSDNNGLTPLLAAIKVGHKGVVEALFNNGIKDLGQNKMGYTALHWATLYGHLKIMRFLITLGDGEEKKLDALDAKDKGGLTPLMGAAKQGNSGAVQLLLEYGADSNIPDNGGLTALHWAAFFGHEHVVEALAEAGADPNAQNNRNETPLGLAIEARHDGVAKILRQHRAVSGGNSCRQIIHSI